MNPNAFNVSTKPHFHTTAGPDSLSHNSLVSGPNLMNQVSYESLKRLCSNGKGLTGFGSLLGEIVCTIQVVQTGAEKLTFMQIDD